MPLKPQAFLSKLSNNFLSAVDGTPFKAVKEVIANLAPAFTAAL